MSEDKNFVQAQDRISLRSVNLASNPLNINGNAQLSTQASTGDGSSGNPYIIENYTISSCGSNINGVSIQNTNKHFILRSIIVSGCHYGFYFNNVTFGSIINVSATYNLRGFYFSNVSFSNISNSLATYCSQEGFYFFNAKFNRIVDSFGMNNEGMNFVFWLSSNNTIIGNTAEGNYQEWLSHGLGFDLKISNANVLIDNRAINNYIGFHIGSSSNCTLVNNTAVSNLAGFNLDNASNNDLVNNMAINNSDDGFILQYFSSHNTLTNNTTINNGYGFYLDSTANNILNNNTSQYNKENNYYESDSSNNILSNNNFSNPSIISFDVNLVLDLLIVGTIIIVLGLVAVWYSIKRRELKKTH